MSPTPVTRRLLFVGASLLLFSCGVQSPVAEPGTEPPGLIKSYSQGGPTPNWQRPIPNAMLIDDLSSLVTTVRLPFNAIDPSFDNPPSRVEVGPLDSPPEDRVLALSYRGPLGADPANGTTVVLVESATDKGEDHLRAIAAGNSDSGQYSIQRIGQHDVLLISAHGKGRAIAIRDGVMLDVTGPDVTPGEVLQLAARALLSPKILVNPTSSPSRSAG